MFSIRNLLLRHGYAFLFCYIFSVQAGTPIPSDPLLLVMGALVGDHLYRFWPALGVALIAALTGDYIWYELGRLRGRRILSLLCRFTLEPDSCVRNTEAAFSKRGAGALFLAKFVPGMGLVSMPLSGMVGMSRIRFLLTDAAGTATWAAAYLGAGLLLHRQVDAVIIRLGLLGRRAGLVVAALIVAYLAYKYFQRWRFLRQLRINRIEPHEVMRMMEAGQVTIIVDVRHPADVERDGMKLPGALVIRPDELRSRSGEIPRDQEIILYCT